MTLVQEPPHAAGLGLARVRELRLRTKEKQLAKVLGIQGVVRIEELVTELKSTDIVGDQLVIKTGEVERLRMEMMAVEARLASEMDGRLKAEQELVKEKMVRRRMEQQVNRLKEQYFAGIVRTGKAEQRAREVQEQMEGMSRRLARQEEELSFVRGLSPGPSLEKVARENRTNNGEVKWENQTKNGEVNRETKTKNWDVNRENQTKNGEVNRESKSSEGSRFREGGDHRRNRQGVVDGHSDKVGTGLLGKDTHRDSKAMDSENNSKVGRKRGIVPLNSSESGPGSRNSGPGLLGPAPDSEPTSVQDFRSLLAGHSQLLGLAEKEVPYKTVKFGTSWVSSMILPGGEHFRTYPVTYPSQEEAERGLARMVVKSLRAAGKLPSI